MVRATFCLVAKGLLFASIIATAGSLKSSNICSNRESLNHAFCRRSLLDQSQRSLFVGLVAAVGVPWNKQFTNPANSQELASTKFRTQAFDSPEYTNSITASKDTNVSPKEAYEVLIEQVSPLLKKNDGKSLGWALDLGAGAGVSTQTLYQMGFTNMDAVDWSGLAWETNVVECPSTVTFFEMDDDRFFRQPQATSKKYQVIVYNFAINFDKAAKVARRYLDPEGGRLLAPINAQQDYWLKQTYYVLDAKGDIKWKSSADVGAWSVQFQPDVTSDTCQGVWCPPFNGFVKIRN